MTGEEKGLSRPPALDIRAGSHHRRQKRWKESKSQRLKGIER